MQQVRREHIKAGVAWQLDQTLELPFVLRATQRALTQAKPVI